MEMDRMLEPACADIPLNVELETHHHSESNSPLLHMTEAKFPEFQPLIET